jgi:hypothetical protein
MYLSVAGLIKYLTHVKTYGKNLTPSLFILDKEV